MIALGWDNAIMGGVLPFAGGFQRDDGLGTCVFISLFTDGRLGADDAPADQRGGWHGDALAEVEGDRIGSKLRLLKWRKETEETRQQAEEWTAEALGWMVTEGLVTGIEVEGAWVAPGVLGMRVGFQGGSTAAPVVFQLQVGA
jgi:phage gp46-like protein